MLCQFDEHVFVGDEENCRRCHKDFHFIYQHNESVLKQLQVQFERLLSGTAVPALA